MNAGIPAIDRTIQETNIWLRGIEERLGVEDRPLAYTLLKAVLKALRDRLGPENAAHLSAQLPTLIRGVFFEGWHIAGTPTRERTVEGFLAHVREELPRTFDFDLQAGVRATFAVLRERIDAGEAAKIGKILPPELAKFLAEAAEADD